MTPVDGSLPTLAASAALGRDELAAWLRLTRVEGVGPATACRLLAAFGLPQDLFDQPLRALEGSVGPQLAAAVREPPPDLDVATDAAWAWLTGAEAGQPARHILTLADPRYPRHLLQMADPPLLLYALGQAPDALATIGERAIAVVGSRNPTPQGERHARAFARALAQSGLVVVSGLALGIDGAAHQGALDGAPATMAPPVTVAVVGTGLDRVYPRQHRALAHAIAGRGLIVSEYPLGTPPLAQNFPRRNRILAALGRGTLVVEAALQSGSLITARLAVEQGRDVFAIPGSIDSPQSRGCHALIKQGARLVEAAGDILDEWHWQPASPATPAVSRGTPGQAEAGSPRSDDTNPAADTARGEDAIERALGHEPCALDELLARTGLDAAWLQGRLMEMELDGRVARMPGGRFQRIAAA